MFGGLSGGAGARCVVSTEQISTPLPGQRTAALLMDLSLPIQHHHPPHLPTDIANCHSHTLQYPEAEPINSLLLYSYEMAAWLDVKYGSLFS